VEPAIYAISIFSDNYKHSFVSILVRQKLAPASIALYLFIIGGNFEFEI
jgi:hypothetical protein